ncbi:hypothetical protein BKA66DRAFT_142388 [Pyrenochaeta sp. MPI-SDFR-AT-0127]|nr:hypothetical protein BKA66DRAFT_142388 [Pyrenochaeta sp. MPI-SDFR-AT-0127]
MLICSQRADLPALPASCICCTWAIKISIHCPLIVNSSTDLAIYRQSCFQQIFKSTCHWVEYCSPPRSPTDLYCPAVQMVCQSTSAFTWQPTGVIDRRTWNPSNEQQASNHDRTGFTSAPAGFILWISHLFCSYSICYAWIPTLSAFKPYTPLRASRGYLAILQQLTRASYESHFSTLTIHIHTLDSRAVEARVSCSPERQHTHPTRILSLARLCLRHWHTLLGGSYPGSS